MRAAELPQLKKRVTQEQVQRYARASGDFNPIHVDAAYAATTPYGRPIAHGMLLFAFLAEMMAAAFGQSWLQGGKLQVRLRAPAFPGDTVTTYGTLKDQQEAGDTLRLEYLVGLRNQQGEELASGEAAVVVPSPARQAPPPQGRRHE